MFNPILRPCFRTFIIFFLVGNCINIHSQNAPLEPRASIDEVWRKDMNIPVSGEIRTGLVADISGDQQVKEFFYVNLPKEKSDVLFVEITSNDGRYNANLSFDIKNKPAGPLQLKWSTKFYNELKEFNYKELTILAWLENKENQSNREFIVSSWSTISSKEFVYVILNSEQQSFVNLYDTTSKKSTNIKCEQFADQVHVSFNSYCKIPLNSIHKNIQISIIQRARRSFNKYPIILKI